MKLGAEHIKYALITLANNTTRVKDMKQYMLAVLYNAPTTISSYYQNWIQHDMANGLIQQVIIMSRATIMAVVNQKGGTGKTTTCENLGIGLANEGKRVLLVDTDPQASLTISLGHPRPDDLPVTLTDLMAKVMQDQPIAPKEGILSHEEGVDLVPANITLSGMEVSLVNAMSRENVLRQVLDALKLQYDYSKTRATYEEYRKAGYSKKFLEAHREEITIHKAAKAAFDELGVKKLPRVKYLSIEYAEVLAAKKKTYAEYRQVKNDTQEFLIAQQNIASLYDAERKEEEQKRRKDEQSH